METKQCGACGGKAMVVESKDQDMAYKGETITVKALPGWHCTTCGDSEFVSPADAEQFSNEVSAAMQVIDVKQAMEVRAIRKRLGLKQAEAAALFGGGANAFSEYERGLRKPAKSTILLLKLLNLHPELLSEIQLFHF